jgi:hypothetical protein
LQFKFQMDPFTFFNAGQQFAYWAILAHPQSSRRLSCNHLWRIRLPQFTTWRLLACWSDAGQFVFAETTTLDSIASFRERKFVVALLRHFASRSSLLGKFTLMFFYNLNHSGSRLMGSLRDRDKLIPITDW